MIQNENILNEHRRDYPVRERYFRVHPLKRYNLIINFRDGGSEIISHETAFILELCGGSYDLETIIEITVGTFKLQEELAKLYLKDIFNKYAAHLRFSSTQVTDGPPSDPMRVLVKDQQEWRYSPWRQEKPEELVISLTYHCNHRCNYCCNSSAEKLPDELSGKQWLEVIDQAAELGVKSITFSGGEPLLHESFLEIIKHTSSQGIYPIISTNGTLITEKLAEQLAKAGADFIHLSMSALDEKVYDQIVGRAGNLPKVKAAIRYLKRFGFYLRLKMVLMSENIAEVEGLLDFCAQEKVDCVHLAPFRYTHLARGSAKLLPSRAELERVAQIAKSKSELYGSSIQIAPPPSEDLAWHQPQDIVRCGGIKTKLTLLPNGNITLCEALGNHPNFIIGNVQKDSLGEIWDSEKPDLVNSCKQNVVDEPCKSCEHLDNCGTGCFVCSLIYSENPWSIDPRCWKAKLAQNVFRASGR